MSFNSFEFPIFFIIVFFLYLSLKHKWQNRLLLLASYVFYGFWDWRFLCLIMISTLTDYYCALKIGNASRRDERKTYLMISLLVNLSILGFFKYFNFFLDNFFALASIVGIESAQPALKIILPVGISFYTFQTMSYTIDVYRKEIKPASKILDYALYVSFFPQLVAGPIERARNLLPQIQHPRMMNRNTLYEGLFLVCWGYFKKKFIVDNIAAFLPLYAQKISLAGPAAGDGGLILATTYAFLFQLYGDFSAYTDIARGTAKLLGFNLSNNFLAPFYAANIQEVWNRWHMSLTSWIRDYIYYPLATLKIGRFYLNPTVSVIITFLIMGLWHGASWNFVLWGGYNGVLLAAYAVFHRKTRKFRRERPAYIALPVRILSTLLTFNLAAFGLIFFRADSLPQLLYWFNQVFTNFAVTPEMLDLALKTFLYSSPLLLVDFMIYKNEDITRFINYSAFVKFVFIYVILYLMIVFRASATNFIYFQF